jgi:hypothetical protein
MLDAKAASDVGWETAAKRADAMEKLVDRKVFKGPYLPLESRPDRRPGSTSLSPFSTSYGSGFLLANGNNRHQKGAFPLVKENRHPAMPLRSRILFIKKQWPSPTAPHPQSPQTDVLHPSE